jgi:hypothetical protein
MKNVLILSLLLVGAFFFAGCSSVDVSTTLNNQLLTEQKEKPIANINVDIYGYYFFTIGPLWTGDPDTLGGILWFEDTVTVDNAVKMLTSKSKELGASKTVDLQTLYTSNWLPWTLMFWCREIHASGNAIK